MIVNVKDVKVEGFFDTRRILDRYHYNITKTRLKKETDAVMPTWENLVKEGITEDLRVLISDMTVTVFDKNGYKFVYDFKAGYVTDLASVPKFLRSFVDNDDKRIVLAALVHDANFGCQYLSFEASNDMFRQMIRKAGGSWWLGFKSYWGVNNWKGRSVYDLISSNFSGVNKEKEFCKFSWSDS